MYGTDPEPKNRSNLQERKCITLQQPSLASGKTKTRYSGTPFSRTGIRQQDHNL